MDTKEKIEELEENNRCEENSNHTCNCHHENDKKCDCKEENSEHRCKCHENKKGHHKHHDNKAAEQIKKLEEENKELVEKVKLAQAELVNYRRRKEEENTNNLKYANKDLITELIPLVDNFERAIKLDDNDLTDELSKFLAGFKMMYASLTDILKKFGVEEINRVGEVFDPNLEQALMVENNSELEDDTVIEVLLKGYKLKDRVIRPASVKINKK